MTYDKLLDECINKDIKVKEITLKGSSGRCDGNRICINKNISTIKEKKCILAEELGHYYTTYGDILDQANINNIKQEIIARRWSYKKLIDIVDIINAHKFGVKNRYELAMYLDVTEEFLIQSLEYYKCKYGIYYQIDRYLIRFEPLGVLELFQGEVL